ncbi:MAG: hypothetical protein K2P58_09260 [Hyphomonadaceae bacterium]|nr:hypothetical protein [Hyphomonadaceae bacterium]
MRHDSTLVLARVVGPVLIIAGILLITQPDRVITSLGSYLLNDAVLILAAFMSLILGLAIVTYHPRWDTVSGIFISLIGYVLTLRGVVLLLAPQIMHDAVMFVTTQPHVFPIGGCAVALLGVWLAYVGYISGTLRAA